MSVILPSSLTSVLMVQIVSMESTDIRVLVFRAGQGADVTLSVIQIITLYIAFL